MGFLGSWEQKGADAISEKRDKRHKKNIVVPVTGACKARLRLPTQVHTAHLYFNRCMFCV